MLWKEMRDAVKDAESTVRLADGLAEDMAKLLKGRLRNCYVGDLCELKRELKGFNMATGQWKKLGD